MIAKKGEKSGFGRFNKDYWRIDVARKEEVLNLLRELPVQHEDKIRMKNMILDTEDAKLWSEVDERVAALRKQIGDEIEQCRLKSKMEYERRHGEALPLAPRERHSSF